MFSANFHVDGGHIDVKHGGLHGSGHHGLEGALLHGGAHALAHGGAHALAHGMEHSLHHAPPHHGKHHDKHHTLEHAVGDALVHGAAHAMVHGAVHHSLEHSLEHGLKIDVHHDKHHRNKHHHESLHVSGDVIAASAHAAVHVAEAFSAVAVAVSPVLPKIVPALVAPIVHLIDRSNRVYITLNQPSYVAGDVVSGTVEMDCTVPFLANGVLLKVKGFERVWWEYQVTEYEGEGQNRRAIPVTKEVKENKEFFRDTIRVYPQQGTVAPGHYSFPFTYQLPPTLPGTYCEEGGHHGARFHAKVLYKLKATMDVAFRHDLHSTTKLVINEKFDRLVQPSYAENHKSFLTSSGNLHIRTWLDKNCYFPGESVLVKLKANNTSVKPTRKIHVRVVHCLELRAHHQHFRESHVEYEQTFTGFEPCYYGVKWMPFNIPVGLIKPSVTQGNHVFSSYLLHIECDIPAATDLAVALPVRILAPQYLFSTAPPQPQAAVLPPTVLIRPPWQPDNQASSCNGCKANFTLINRRHHCRHCAKVFCGKCVDKKVAIAKLKYKDPVRVCNGCMPEAQKGGKKYQSSKEIMAQWQQSQGYVANGASSPVLNLTSAPPS